MLPCHCFPGQSPSAADDLQRSLREAAGVSAADGTVESPPTPPEESLHHRPVLPLPVHQKEDLAVRKLSKREKKYPAGLHSWMEKADMWRQTRLKFHANCVNSRLHLFLGGGGWGGLLLLPFRQLSVAVCQQHASAPVPCLHQTGPGLFARQPCQRLVCTSAH